MRTFQSVTPGLPLRGFSGSTDRSIQRVQKLMRRSVDMIDRCELFRSYVRDDLACLLSARTHTFAFLLSWHLQVADRIFCHDRLNRLNRSAGSRLPVNGRKYFLKSLRFRPFL